MSEGKNGYGFKPLSKMNESTIDTRETSEPFAANPEGKYKISPNAFPFSVMSGAAGHFAKLHASYMESPVEFFYMAYLTCLGAILAGLVTIESEINPQPRLYTVLLGESADDRKSTAIKKTVEMFEKVVPSFSTSWGVGSAEGLQKMLQGKENYLLCFDELKAFISKCCIQQSVLLPCVNTLFESNNYDNQTKNSQFQLSGVNLSIIAASTLQTYERTWKASFTDIGFNNRLFIVPGKSMKRVSLPKVIPENQKEICKAYIDSIIQYYEKGIELNFTEEAQSRFNEWYNTREKGIHSKRLDVYALRLMILIAASDLKNEIDLDIVQKAISLVDWQLEMRRQYDPIDAENTIARMEEKIRRKLKSKGPLKERQIRQAVNGDRDGIWLFKKALENLKVAKDIVFDLPLQKYRICES